MVIAPPQRSGALPGERRQLRERGKGSDYQFSKSVIYCLRSKRSKWGSIIRNTLGQKWQLWCEEAPARFSTERIERKSDPDG